MPASTPPRSTRRLSLIRTIAEPRRHHHRDRAPDEGRAVDLSHRIVVLHHGQLIARASRRRSCSDPRVDRGLSRLASIAERQKPSWPMADAACLRVQASAGRLRRRAGAVGRRPRGRRRRARLPDRFERRRQDHACCARSRACSRRRAGAIAVDGRDLTQRHAGRHRARRHRARAGRAAACSRP